MTDAPGTRRPGTRITDTIEHGTRQAGEVTVHITETVWNGGGRSFDVYRDSDGKCLTEDASLDAMPDAAQLAALVPGCPHPEDRQYVRDGQFHCGRCDEWLGR